MKNHFAENDIADLKHFNTNMGFVRIIKITFLLATNLFEFGLMKRREIPFNVCIRREGERGTGRAVYSGGSCAVRECLVIWCSFRFISQIILSRKFGYLLLFDKPKCENHCYLFQ